MMRFSLLVLIFLTLFLAPAPAGRQLRADETIKQRLARIEQMSAAEKTLLLRNKRRFEELSKADQERLRGLHEQLSTDAQADCLREVLERYNAWLRTLTPGERAEIIRLPADKRIARIKEFMRAQEAKRFRMMVDGRLSQDDLSAIRKWLGEFIEARESEILAALPADRFAEFRKNYDPEKHRRFLTFMMFRHDAPDVLRPTKDAIALLPGKLSPEARDFLANLSAEEQSTVIRNWIRAAVFSRIRPPVSQEELKKFVAEKLDARQREYLESLPLDRMHAELRRLYHMDRFGRYRGGRRSPGGGPRPDQMRGSGPGPPGGKGLIPRGLHGRGPLRKGDEKPAGDRPGEKADKRPSFDAT